MSKGPVRNIGNFEPEYKPPKKRRLCRNCNRSVSTTVGNCGYCRECISLARKENGIGK